MKESKTVKPTFIQMGSDDFINLNTVKRIEFVIMKDKRVGVAFLFIDGKDLLLQVKDCDSFKDTIKDLISYHFEVEDVTLRT